MTQPPHTPPPPPPLPATAFCARFKGKADGSTKPDDCIGDASLWAPAPLMKPSTPSTVSADLTNLKLGAAGVLAVRYGWPV